MAPVPSSNGLIATINQVPCAATRLAISSGFCRSEPCNDNLCLYTQLQLLNQNDHHVDQVTMSPSRPLSFRDDYKAGDDLQGLFLLFVNWGGFSTSHQLEA